jgi:hypothetical protein
MALLALATPHPLGGYRGVLYDAAEAVDVYVCPHRHRGWSAVDRARACVVREWQRRERAKGTAYLPTRSAVTRP